VLALTLGLRRGEPLGLRWTDVDFKTSLLRVERTLSRVTGRGLVASTPKTESGARTIPLVAGTDRALRNHQARQSIERNTADEHWTESGHIFTSEIGSPLDPANALH
jgi:integrase